MNPVFNEAVSELMLKITELTDKAQKNMEEIRRSKNALKAEIYKLEKLALKDLPGEEEMKRRSERVMELSDLIDDIVDGVHRPGGGRKKKPINLF